MSKNNFEITTKLVTKLINSQFPEYKGLPIRPVAQSGWDNRTFHLGDDMLIRLPSAKCYCAQVSKEHKWLPFLASKLPVAIPTPLKRGVGDFGFDCEWSIYGWIDGEVASSGNVPDLSCFARELGLFLKALYAIDATGGPEASEHNFHRGGSLHTYDAQTREAIAILKNKIDSKKATKIWEEALSTNWQKPPVWVHGDIAPGNLLVKNGHLSAVIDFGCLGVGDPACDFAIAWSFFDDKSAKALKKYAKIDENTWIRARGWALWKALIVCAGLCGATENEVKQSYINVARLLANGTQ